MPTENVNQRANLDVTPGTARPRALPGHPLAVATAVVFFISSAFPVLAGLSKTRHLPKMVGHA